MEYKYKLVAIDFNNDYHIKLANSKTQLKVYAETNLRSNDYTIISLK